VRKGGNPRNRNTQGVFCKIHDSLNSNLDLGLIIEERRGHFAKMPPLLSGPGWVGRPAHRAAHGPLACLPLAAAHRAGLLLPRLGRQYAAGPPASPPHRWAGWCCRLGCLLAGQAKLGHLLTDGLL